MFQCENGHNSPHFEKIEYVFDGVPDQADRDFKIRYVGSGYCHSWAGNGLVAVRTPFGDVVASGSSNGYQTQLRPLRDYEVELTSVIAFAKERKLPILATKDEWDSYDRDYTNLVFLVRLEGCPDA